MRHIASRTSPGQPLLVSAGRRMKKLRTLAVQPRYPAHAPATGVWSNGLNLLRSDGRVQGAARPPQVRIGRAMTAVHRAEVAHQRSLAKISRCSRRARAL